MYQGAPKERLGGGPGTTPFPRLPPRALGHPRGPSATPLLGWGQRPLGAAGGPITGGDLQEWPGVWASLGGQAKLSVGVRGIKNIQEVSVFDNVLHSLVSL